MDTSTLKSELSKRVVTVTFTKANGEVRVMHCTKNLDFVPPSMWPKGEVEIAESTKDSSARVFDVAANGWRSFVYDRVITAQ